MSSSLKLRKKMTKMQTAKQEKGKEKRTDIEHMDVIEHLQRGFADLTTKVHDLLVINSSGGMMRTLRRGRPADS